MGDVAECAAFGGVSSGSRSHSAGINGNKKNRFREKNPELIMVYGRKRLASWMQSEHKGEKEWRVEEHIVLAVE